jgi:hypothetical protein
MSLRLPYFAACPAELRGAKKLWYDQYDFPPRRTGFPPWRLGVFARLIHFFLRAKTHRGRQAQRNCGPVTS